MTAFHQSSEWQALRKKALERDGHRCTQCERGRGDGVKLHVDHRVPVALGGPPLDLNNTVTLCAPCHQRKTRADRKAMAEAGVGPRGGSNKNVGKTHSFSDKGTLHRPLGKSFARNEADDRKSSRSRLTGAEDAGEPRFFSEPHPESVGTRFEEVAAWQKANLGTVPRGWQERVLRRMLEVRADGTWCWSGGFIVSVPRQTGKSTGILQPFAGWLAEEHHRIVLACTNRLRTSSQIIRPLGMLAKDKGGMWLRQADQPEANFAGGGRVVFQASNDTFAVGWSADAVFADEAWDIAPNVLHDAGIPAMSDSDNPYLLLTSTIGAASSTLLHGYRDVALAGGGKVGIAEWSAEPGADWLDEDVWRSAHPYWTPRRLSFLRDQVSSIKESAFRAQYLNQVVTTENGWIGDDLWSGCFGKTAWEKGYEVAGVEITLDGSRHYVVLASRDDAGVIHVESHQFGSFKAVNEFVNRRRPATVLAGRIYENRLDRITRIVTTGEIAKAMPVFQDLLRSKKLRHEGDPVLTESVLSAEHYVTKDGRQTLISKEGRNLSPMRAMLFAIGDASEARGGKPRLRVAR